MSPIPLGIAAASVAAGGVGTYVDEVTADGPVLWWRLGEGTGSTAEDNSGDNRDGTYVGTLDRTWSSLVGDTDWAVAGGNNGGYVQRLSDSFWDSITGLSIELTGYGTVPSGGFVIGFQDASGKKTGFNLYAGRIYPTWDGTEVNFIENISPYDKWHVVLTFGSNGRGLYFNGAEQRAVAAQTFVAPASSAFAVGAFVKPDGTASSRGDGTGYFVIDEAVVYDYVLSESRINAHATAAGISTDVGLLTYRGNGLVASSSGYTVTFTGMPIGPASAEREVVAVLTANQTDTRSITGVTIGGVTATIDVQSPNYAGVAVARAAIPTGTTADVVVTWTGTENNNGHMCSIYTSAVPLLLIDSDSVLDTTDTGSLELNTVNNGAVVAGHGSFLAQDRVVWDGLTERNDLTYGTAYYPAGISDGARNGVASGTHIVTAYFPSSQTFGLAAASYGEDV